MYGHQRKKGRGGKNWDIGNDIYTIDTMYKIDSSVHGILQARILEWVAISFFMGSSQQTQVSHIAGRCFNPWATREAHKIDN